MSANLERRNRPPPMDAERRLAAALELMRWVQQTTHQAHHGHLDTTTNRCPQSTCDAITRFLEVEP